MTPAGKLQSPICVTCGSAFPPAPGPPAGCPICLDERQYVGHDGQRWTTMPELAAEHANRTAEVEPGLLEITTRPSFAIGQRALLSDGLLWDCVSLLDDAAVAAAEAHGGIEAIAISHPHFYSSMVAWADRFDCPVWLHADDREHVMRESPRLRFWEGERLELATGHTLVRLGGHFEGASVCLWPAGSGGGGSLLSGDVVQVVADRDRVSFMRSYPNLIPLPAATVERIAATLAGLEFERIHGGWSGTEVEPDARAKAIASAERYVRALDPELERRRHG